MQQFIANLFLLKYMHFIFVPTPQQFYLKILHHSHAHNKMMSHNLFCVAWFKWHKLTMHLHSRKNTIVLEAPYAPLGFGLIFLGWAMVFEKVVVRCGM